MSRIGKNPIAVPDSVNVAISSSEVKVNGRKGELSIELHDGITVVNDEKQLRVTRRDDSKPQRSLHGLTRALIANMVHGVEKGFSKELEIVGVGYRCEPKGKATQFSIGFSHKVIFIPPEGITINVKSNTSLNVEGIDKQLVGEVAAKIRKIRPPEPYKGKGIHYVGEYIRRKAGKATAK
ncbi:50S ribosomal protein L6 [bacterium]|nr:50S ribosomal protein L6 [bacterium]